MNEILFTTKYPDRVLARRVRAYEHRFARTRASGIARSMVNAGDQLVPASFLTQYLSMLIVSSYV